MDESEMVYQSFDHIPFETDRTSKEERLTNSVVVDVVVVVVVFVVVWSEGAFVLTNPYTCDPVGCKWSKDLLLRMDRRSSSWLVGRTLHLARWPQVWAEMWL